MTEYKTHILSTRPLEAALLEQAAGKGIWIDALPFITTEPITDEALRLRIRDLSRSQSQSQSSILAVFTSMNAVEAVAECLKHTPAAGKAEMHGPQNDGAQDDIRAVSPDWQIFCIGSATQQLVRENFGDDRITGTAASAALLADTIVDWLKRKTEEQAREVFFFCGDQRRDELPEKLRQQDIKVNELVVYKTIQTPHKLEKSYDGIVFFSPSAVHSFFRVNDISVGTTLFSIGQTTADTIRTYTSNQTILSRSTEKSALIRQVIDYYNRVEPGCEHINKP
jgi:uroporphyrinogen-III synthase